MKTTKKQIKEWNEYFNSLTPAQKRVAIAKDVIEQVNLKRFIPKNRIYTKIVSKIEDVENQIQSEFNNIQCHCCALGGMFLSDIKFNNSCTFYELDNKIFQATEKDRLQQYFSIEQLILIEAAFECWSCEDITSYDNVEEDYVIDQGYGIDLYLSDLNIGEEDINKAGDFGNKYRDNSERLMAIMNNIIKNKGKFKV